MNSYMGTGTTLQLRSGNTYCSFGTSASVGGFQCRPSVDSLHRALDIALALAEGTEGAGGG